MFQVGNVVWTQVFSLEVTQGAPNTSGAVEYIYNVLNTHACKKYYINHFIKTLAYSIIG